MRHLVIGIVDRKAGFLFEDLLGASCRELDYRQCRFQRGWMSSHNPKKLLSRESTGS